ncbi:MAG: class I SAM-dependent rRNA methyltransferase [Anaerolineae bacterium]
MSTAQAAAPILSQIPGSSARRIAVHVAPAAERALREGHPWLFAGSIREQSREGAPGDLAVVFDRKERFLAVGLYDPLSSIRVRILQHGEPAPIDPEWFTARLTAAAARRGSLIDRPVAARTTGYRLVHGENDGLPGLVVDRYAETLVIKLYTAAWVPHLRDVLAPLTSIAPAERWVLRLGRAMQEQAQHLHGLRDGLVLYGPALAGPVLFWENGLRFEADPVRGQKTGFFLDQRENRARVEPLAGGKEVLNVFAYTGGFSVYAARGGARRVVDIDASAQALAASERNLAHNRDIPGVVTVLHETVVDDAFKALARMGEATRRFDLVIVDPPAFARSRVQVDGAISAYRRLTELSFGVLSPGGTLVQASCSRRVDPATFFDTVHRAARGLGRPLRELARTGHPEDHPIAFKGGAYLKCLFAQVP